MKTVRMFEQNEFEILMRRLDLIEVKIDNIKPRTTDRRLNFKQAAAFLNMHRHTLSTKFKNGDYPTSLIHVIGKTKYLLESELEEFKKTS